MYYDKDKLFIDFNIAEGPIKPLNGVNNGPLTVNFSQDSSRYFKEAGIPFSRLHDVEYPFGHGEFVDVNCIFKNFNRDPEDPSAYDFAFTDRYLKAIAETGAKIIYRLGCSIEHQKTKRYIFPPRDYRKWAQICEHIILHYNEGWNSGHFLNIEFWEIWNEPDGILWNADNKEYFRLYKETSTYLKKKFPQLKFGGPALCNGSNDFAEEMMEYITSGERAPMDFYSWHTYCSTPEIMKKNADAASSLLKRYGYSDALSIVDEWNYVINWENVGDSWNVIHSVKGAAFNAAIMSVLQSSGTDIATYYDAQLCFEKWWNGLFSKGHREYNGDEIDFYGSVREVVPLKGYYPFKAFHTLQKLGTQARAITYAEHLYVTAATNGKEHAVMLTNFSNDKEETVTVQPVIKSAAVSSSEFYLLDEMHDLDLVSKTDVIPETIVLQPNSVLLWIFRGN